MTPLFKFLCSLVCLLFCLQVGAKRRETTNFNCSKLPEVTLKPHDQSIVAFYHGHPLPRMCCKYF